MRKKYEFENVLNSNIYLSVKAYSEAEAWEMLKMTVIDIEDYKLIG